MLLPVDGLAEVATAWIPWWGGGHAVLRNCGGGREGAREAPPGGPGGFPTSATALEEPSLLFTLVQLSC